MSAGDFAWWDEPESRAEQLAAFYAQASPEEAEEQARSDGWRPSRG